MSIRPDNLQGNSLARRGPSRLPARRRCSMQEAGRREPTGTEQIDAPAPARFATGRSGRQIVYSGAMSRIPFAAPLAPFRRRGGAVAPAAWPAAGRPAPALPRRPAPPPPRRRPTPPFELTVDSIMRGPALVGYPPGALRWSGDSERLYFEWRPRGEDEPATWEVARACLGAAPAPGGEDRANRAGLTDDERRLAPPADGEWDAAHRRSVGIVDGDVVVVDTVARTRTLITRTAAAEAHARWSDGGRAVTFVRDQGLHRVWIDCRIRAGGAARAVTAFEQLDRRGPAQAASRDHRQPAVPQVRRGAAPRRRPRERSPQGAGRSPQGRAGGGAPGVGEHQSVEDSGARA